MDHKEIEEELKMTYEELQCYLIQKYSAAIYDYFATPECKSKNKKVSRTSDGLYCHHMDEDKGGSLSSPSTAKMQPFEWQKKERLVYCNILEHLILHMKIAILRQKKMLKKPIEIRDFFSTNGIFAICEEINDMFMNDGTKIAWKKRCFKEIEGNYEDYIVLLNSLINYIETSYSGNKTKPAFLVPGSKVHFSDCDCEILKLSAKKDTFLLKLPSGENHTFYSTVAYEQFTYADQLDLTIRKMSSGFESFYTYIYEDITKYGSENLIATWGRLLKNDYQGYGYAQYAGITLDKSFGARNADEYISKALPMYCENIVDLNGKIPHFWKGPKFPENIKNLFYIIRVKVSFSLKENMEPFIRYKEVDLLRGTNIFRSINNHHNLREKGWTMLTTSDVYDRKTNRYYSEYVDFDGKIIDAKVTLSLGKGDYLLFRERYNIRDIEILDGCYFC